MRNKIVGEKNLNKSKTMKRIDELYLFNIFR